MGTPQINLPLPNGDEQKRYKLGQIEVLADPNTPVTPPRPATPVQPAPAQ